MVAFKIGMGEYGINVVYKIDMVEGCLQRRDDNIVDHLLASS